MLIVSWLSKRVRPLWLAIIGAVCFLSTLPGTLWYGIIAGTPIRNVYWTYNMLFCPANSFVVAIPWCVIGKLLADGYSISTKKGIILATIAILSSVLELSICKESYWMSDTYLSLLFSAPLIVVFLTKLQLPLDKEVSVWLRNISTLVYLLHLPIRFILSRAFQLSNGWQLFLLTLSVSIALSVFIKTLSKRITALRYLY